MSRVRVIRPNPDSWDECMRDLHLGFSRLAAAAGVAPLNPNPFPRLRIWRWWP